MAVKIFRVNYKSDFILTLNSDAGWMTPFCIKFWTGAPSQAYFVGFDGTTYTHCAPVAGEPTKLVVQFDDHHLPIGDLKFQIAYHFTVADFPNDTEDEVINPAGIIIEINSEQYQVMLDFTGETAPEIEFSLPAYANEDQRIANEEQRIAAEQQRIANEDARIQADETRQQNEQQRIAQETARVNEFATLKSQSQAATRDANDAATLANQKAQLAADKAALADDAATLANQKAQLAADKAALADAAATLANDKAALAQQKAEYAQQQGSYAKDQGDYAKSQGNYANEQGEIVQADHVRAEADHGIAVDDHTQAGNDHTRAESDHGIAVDDHTQAGNDHTRAESDHGIAADDHTQAGNDHTRAESDHGIAANDHTQAGNDHTRAESDHTRAEGDHAAVEVYVDSLGAFDISAYHATGGVLAKYADLTDALGTGGANIPDALRKGGMSVKFVQSSDNKYVQYRLMSDTFSTTESDWQGVDETPTAGSQNLVKSWGILSETQSKEIDFTGVVPVDWFVTSGIPYYGSDGSENTNDSRRRTNYIKVKEGDAFAYTMNNNDTLLIIAVFNNGVLDLTHSVAGAGVAANGTYTVPAGVTHIQFCNSKNHTPTITKTNPTHLDAVPTQNSGNLVKSGGVYSSINTAKAEVEVELAASIITEDKQLKNLLHTEYVLIDGGIDAETGDETTNTRYKHTALFPVKDKGYFLVSPVSLVVRYYSAPFIDTEYYLGYTSSSSDVPEGAKYCSFLIDTNSFPSIDTLRIIPKEDLDSYLGETCVGISDTYKMNTDYDTLLKYLNFYKYAVKGMYLYGDSVDSSQDYLINVRSYVASTRTLRIIISQYVNGSYTSIIDKTVVVSEDKYLDTVLTQDTYNFRIIADFNNVGDLTAEYSSNDYFKFNSRVFYPIVNDVTLKEDVEGLAEDLSELSDSVDELAENMNNANEILVDTSNTEVIDYTEYYDTGKGAETGKYILLSSGQKKSNNNYTVTPYISTNGITAIRTLVPSNSAGLGFYTGNDESKYAAEYIKGYGVSYADGVKWIEVPQNAKYFRTTVGNSALTSEPPTAILDVKKKAMQTLQEFVDGQEKPTPRNTHVLYGYEGFCHGQKVGNDWINGTKLQTARNTMSQATQDNDIKQIVSENQLYFNKMNYEVTFEVKDADTFIGIGFYPLIPYVFNEVRVRNDNGSAVLEVYGGIGDPGDTYTSEDFAVAESVVLPYSLTVGNVYTLGMKRFEDETYNNTDHVDGAIYYIHSYADDADADTPTEIFIPRNSSTSTGGVTNKTVAAFKGYQFVSLKVGEVDIYNLFVSSPYNPQAKAVILGDSYVDGDTLVSQGGQYLKYACMLQEKIGADLFVLAGKGGDAVTDSSKPYLNKETSLFYPKYLIPAFGANYTNLDDFTSQMTSFINWLVKIGIEPILVTMPPVGSKATLMVAENAVVRSLGYRYVDIYKAVTDGNGNWIEGYVLADGVHPTAAGHQAIYEAFVREVPELFAV